jgi:deoxyribodipyrimidine photo-lyase
MPITPIIVWFRSDLRCSDNPALHAAAQTGAPILPVYILDDENAEEWQMGAASRVWLHHSLIKLNDALSGHLYLARGKADDIIPALAKKMDAQGVYWNRCYEPWRITRDKKIKETLKDSDVAGQSFNGSLLWEPWDKHILKSDGTPYKVFTPFYRKGCLSAPPPREPLPAPKRLAYADASGGISIEQLGLLPPSRENGWEKMIVGGWAIGEAGAQKRLRDFIEDGLKNYKEGRNIPAQHHVSRLSPYLHFGEISPNQAWYAIQHAGQAHNWHADTDHFCSELGWREFSYSLLYHNPDLKWKNLQPRFDHFPWDKEGGAALLAWQRGQTGYPIVDAAMRELWQTGYMHNRCRMIVGSFLVKNLLIHWHHGERWFWECLFDADAANNAASWQWIAGCGADAAPYFRVFNPVLQGEKFDPDGTYVRRFVPELADMPGKYLHKPWAAPKDIRAKIRYPDPIVELEGSRNRALEAFKTI